MIKIVGNVGTKRVLSNVPYEIIVSLGMAFLLVYVISNFDNAFTRRRFLPCDVGWHFLLGVTKCYIAKSFLHFFFF